MWAIARHRSREAPARRDEAFMWANINKTHDLKCVLLVKCGNGSNEMNHRQLFPPKKVLYTMENEKEAQQMTRASVTHSSLRTDARGGRECTCDGSTWRHARAISDARGAAAGRESQTCVTHVLLFFQKTVSVTASKVFTTNETPLSLSLLSLSQRPPPASLHVTDKSKKIASVRMIKATDAHHSSDQWTGKFGSISRVIQV